MTSAPAKDFIPFQKLPIELRVKIWNEALPGPQAVIIVSDNQPAVFANGVLQEAVRYQCKAQYEFPSILHVSKESREEALRSYRPAFGVLLNGKPIFFNFSKDELSMKDVKAMDSFNMAISKSNSPASDKDVDNLRFLSIQGKPHLQFHPAYVKYFWKIQVLALDASEYKTSARKVEEAKTKMYNKIRVNWKAAYDMELAQDAKKKAKDEAKKLKQMATKSKKRKRAGEEEGSTELATSPVAAKAITMPLIQFVNGFGANG